ncbi:hypothetical protein L208DRAFT_1419697 [Tricholoma matsutake]|nr:hypothetical protein L208DRAFT_1419697 [Tricholoma matsutake 945]
MVCYTEKMLTILLHRYMRVNLDSEQARVDVFILKISLATNSVDNFEFMLAIVNKLHENSYIYFI